MAGNALTAKGYAETDELGGLPAGSCSAAGSTGGSTGSTSTGIAPPPVHGSKTTRSAKNSHVARPIASTGSAISAPSRP